MSAKKLALGALAIALSLISFTLFKGVTNVLNALFVTLIFSLLLSSLNLKEYLAAAIALILFVLVLFPVQIFFIPVYLFVSYILIAANKKNIRKLAVVLFVSVVLSILFTIAISFTDLVFNTQMYKIMMSIYNGNFFIYFAVIFFEALIISIIVFFVQRIFALRINKLLFGG